MKIKRIKIQNYKTIKSIELDMFDDITLIVGKNNIGKSNILQALGIFFECLGKKKNEGIVPTDDFRKGSSQIIIEVTFGNVTEAINEMKELFVEETQKLRPNKSTIKYHETLYRIFDLIKHKRKNEFSIKLTIPRNNNEEIKPEIIFADHKKKERFNAIMTKRHYAETHIPQELKNKQQSLNTWYEYDWLTIEDNEEKKKIVKLDGEIVGSPDEKVSEIATPKIVEKTIEYISLTQKFFYVPAYRGGKNEREQATNKLFDIIIDDLVVSKKGSRSKDFDTITDAIWGTGKNRNNYNINRVIESRLQQLTSNLKKDSISSIKSIEFRKYEKDEIRRSILKTMLGSAAIVLDDGVRTKFESKGTGIQSSFMITLMKALSAIQFEKGVNIVLVVEEPEAFAHPQLVREIIEKISGEFNRGLFQFMVTTHSPVIVNYVNLNKVQRLTFDASQVETKNVTNIENSPISDQEWNLINRISDVNLSEIVFSDLAIFVEGEGDKIVFEKILKILAPDYLTRMSVISISGNNQIFKMLPLLKYYSIKWLMVFDKDSFVTKSYNSIDLISPAGLDQFFIQYQIGAEYQENFRRVLDNHNVSKIKVQGAASVRIGETLSKINEVYQKADVDEVRNELYRIVSEKMTAEVFPEKDAYSIIERFNMKMRKLEIPFYSLVADLEGMVVNSYTKAVTENIYRHYYSNSFDDFTETNRDANPEEYLRALKMAMGSKTHTISSIAASARDRKKPHIPIEVVSTYLDKLSEQEHDVEVMKQTLINAFPDLKLLMQIIKDELSK